MKHALFLYKIPANILFIISLKDKLPNQTILKVSLFNKYIQC